MLRMYDFKCPHCSTVEEKIVDQDEIPLCEKCYIHMEKLPHTFGINMGVGAYGYYDDNLETYVRTNAHRRELCRQKGVTPSGETPKPDGQAWV